MATNDTRLLLAALEDYQAVLRRHLIELRTEFDRTENRWHAFAYYYEGDAAEQFKFRWLRTVDRFHEYQDRTDAVLRVLEERIEALRRVNQVESGLL